MSLGSNLGDRLANLRRARDRVAAIPGCALRAQSPVYETEPVGVRPEHQPQAFLNAVLILDADLVPETLAGRLLAIETEMGRRRGAARNEPRVIDLDLIYAGSLSIRAPDLAAPHPRWASRRFVVQPLADVRPDLVLPGERRTVRQVLLSLPEAPGATLLAARW
ncbi:MAG: 2-amino-4-hydroxy-6-hydroxymethyldihydropteridine diphosphokinase [Verrucomicrobiota bacterium]|nr:2-amino-4-hydroxy-6-hydroxymethyldihydropteridine diphosphokinase [Verrucomicrobiota bacterium]